MNNTTASPIRPDGPFLLSHPAHTLALGLGSGLSPIMPGTVGTLFGWYSFVYLSRYLTALQWGAVILLGFLIGIWACEKTGRDLGVADHGSMVWDEIIAIWLVLVVVMPTNTMGQMMAVFLFRLFDMLKPGPVRYIERRVKGGLGVMIDDIMAAFLTLLVIAVWQFI